jgi:hypothetical protein
MATFVPFQQSSLFSNIVGGGGQPLGAVPMDFATPTPYKFKTDPITPDPDVPESDFDMNAFCSVPANANHPMCVNTKEVGSGYEPEKVKIEGTDRYTTDDNFIPTDEEIANMTNEEYLANLDQRGWTTNSGLLGVMPSSTDPLTLRSGQIGNPYFTLAFGKLQEAKRNKIIKELADRGLLDSMTEGGEPVIVNRGANVSRSGLKYFDDRDQGAINRGDEAIKPYGETKGTEPTTALTTTNTPEEKKIYDDLVKKKRKGKINLGQMVNEYRKKTGYFSPAQTRDRESSYAQPQGKKGTYSYRARGR